MSHDDTRDPTALRPAIGQGEAVSKTLLRDPMIGMQLGEYEVQKLIGVGGMGLVYRGVQPLIGKPVAIKILRPEISDSSGHVERLLAEARAVNAVRHRGIIDIFSFGQLADGRQYFVMEYLEGQALDDYIREQGVISPGEAVALLQEIAAALHAAHEAGVVHRDLKPNNIFLVKQSGSTYVKLLDFGLAKQAAMAQGSTPQTSSGLVVGTPEYIAPEQARGEAVGPATDLYALGVVAFQMVTGQLPFHGDTAMDYVIAHVQDRPPLARELMPDLPDELSDLIAQLLEKLPSMRPSSADVVRRELKRIARLLPQESTFVGAAPPRPTPPAASPSVPPPAPAPFVVAPTEQIVPSARPLRAGAPARNSAAPVRAGPPTPTVLVQPDAPATDELTPPRRSPLPWLAGALVVFVAAAAGTFTLLKSNTEPPPPQTQPAPVPVTATATVPEVERERERERVPEAEREPVPEAEPVPVTEVGREPPSGPTPPTPALATNPLPSTPRPASTNPRPSRPKLRPPPVTETQPAPEAPPPSALELSRQKALSRVQRIRADFEIRPKASAELLKGRALLTKAEEAARAATTQAELDDVQKKLQLIEDFFLVKQ